MCSFPGFTEKACSIGLIQALMEGNNNRLVVSIWNVFLFTTRDVAIDIVGLHQATGHFDWSHFKVSQLDVFCHRP